MPTGSLKRWTTDRPAGRAAGPCAPQPPARGQVHSVFAGCCNVQLDSQERLLPLLSASLPLQPHGWSVRLPAGSECRDWYRSGMPVTLDAAGLQIGPWPAMECPGQSPAGAFRLPDHGCLSAAGLQLAGRLWAQLWHVPAPASQGWHCPHPWVWPACRQGLLSLDEPEQLPAAVAALVGLGMGLTPSGDDFLCGLIAAVRLHEPALLPVLSDCLPECLSSTRDISRDYLLLSLDGWFSPLVVRLVCAVQSACACTARQDFGRLLAHGASSGRDTALGLLGGMLALHRALPETGRGAGLPGLLPE